MLRILRPNPFLLAAAVACAPTLALAENGQVIFNESPRTVILRIVKADSGGKTITTSMGPKKPDKVLKLAKDAYPVLKDETRVFSYQNGSSFKMELIQSMADKTEEEWPRYTFDVQVKSDNLILSNLKVVGKPSWIVIVRDNKQDLYVQEESRPRSGAVKQ